MSWLAEPPRFSTDPPVMGYRVKMKAMGIALVLALMGCKTAVTSDVHEWVPDWLRRLPGRHGCSRVLLIEIGRDAGPSRPLR